MMTASDNNLLRAFQQMQDAVKESIDQSKPFCFGVAISYITFVFATTKQLADEGRLTSAGEQAQKDAINESPLEIVQSEIHSDKDGTDQVRATFRHLRNCVGHGNWQYDPVDTTASGDIWIILHDYNDKGTLRFSARVPFPDLINLAEKIMVVTFNDLNTSPPTAGASSS